jgi:hypothetical protein
MLRRATAFCLGFLLENQRHHENPLLRQTMTHFTFCFRQPEPTLPDLSTKAFLAIKIATSPLYYNILPPPSSIDKSKLQIFQYPKSTIIGLTPLFKNTYKVPECHACLTAFCLKNCILTTVSPKREEKLCLLTWSCCQWSPIPAV